MDRSLADHAELWAAAGHPHTVFRLTYEDLLRITGGTPADISEFLLPPSRSSP